MTPWLRIIKITKQGIFLVTVFKNTYFVNIFILSGYQHVIKKRRKRNFNHGTSNVPKNVVFGFWIFLLPVIRIYKLYLEVSM